MENEENLRLHRCCFTGNRPEKLTAPVESIMEYLDVQNEKAISEGYTTFITGCARGVDIWAGQIVLQKKTVHPGLRLMRRHRGRDLRTNRARTGEISTVTCYPTLI